METNKKIIIDVTVLNDCQITGVPRVIAELSRRMIKDYQNITFISFDYGIKKMKIVKKDKFIKYISTFKRKYTNFVSNKKFNFNDIDKDTVFFDIGPIEVAYKRSLLYSEFKNKGAKIITLIHDVIPLSLTTVEQKENNIFHFINMFAAIFRYTDLILATTKSESQNIKFYLDKCNCSIPIEIVPLGCNIKETYIENNISKNIIELSKKQYLLMVGTICPRKNHKLVIDSFNKELYKYDVNLVIAGHAGWKCDDIMRSITLSKYYNKRIFFINTPSNDEIIYLYKHAYASIMPSLAEGYGLPVVESLYYGCPLFCSNIPVFHEISKDKAIFFNNQSSDYFFNIITKYLSNKELYNHLKSQISSFDVYSWEESYNRLKEVLNKFN